MPFYLMFSNEFQFFFFFLESMANANLTLLIISAIKYRTVDHVQYLLLIAVIRAVRKVQSAWDKSRLLNFRRRDSRPTVTSDTPACIVWCMKWIKFDNVTYSFQIIPNNIYNKFVINRSPISFLQHLKTYVYIISTLST